MKIGYITADWSDINHPETGIPYMGGSSWYRCYLPGQRMNTIGIETVYTELVSTSSKGGITLHPHDDSEHDDCDIIVIQRWMHKNSLKAIERAKAMGQVVVHDVDDWYWGLDPRNHAYKVSDPKFNEDCNRDWYVESLKQSDYITVSTPYLKEKLEKLTDVPTIVLRNSIDLDRYTPKTHAQSDSTTSGWVGGTKFRSGDLETLQGVLGPFCEQNNCRFLHAGYVEWASHAGEDAGVDHNLWETKEICVLPEYPQLFETMDIGIVPLRDCEFNKAKSFLKGLEYSAAGIPFIASNLPEYKVLEELGIGRTVKNPSQWNAALKRMLDPEVRQEEANKNRQNLQIFNIDNTWKDWAQVYQEMM